MRRIVVIGLGVALSLSLGLGACKKKEEQPVPQAPQMAPGMQMPPGPQMGPGQQMPPGHGEGITVPKGDLKVVVPDSIKGKWSAVKLLVEDKATKKSQEFTVQLNSELQVPNSNLKVTVGEFFPDFKMMEGAITSGSNELKNPAVGVTVYENGKQIFPAPGKKIGWLYGKPELRGIHPFEHPKYGIILKEAVKKG